MPLNKETKPNQSKRKPTEKDVTKSVQSRHDRWQLLMLQTRDQLNVHTEEQVSRNWRYQKYIYLYLQVFFFHYHRLHSLERAAAGIGLYVNAHKTEYMCYNQTGDISTLDGTPLKLVDKFTYLESSVESTEKDIDTRLTKAWTAINRLSIIWKSDLTDKMKRSFFQAAVTSILLYGCTTWTLTKRLEKKLLHKNAASNLEQVLAATPHKTPTV